MKKITIVAVAMLTSAITAWGADYAGMSTDELLNQRGVSKTQEERQALHKELTKRYEHMNQEQKREFDSRPGKGMQGQGGMGYGKGPGGGMGMGKNH